MPKRPTSLPIEAPYTQKLAAIAQGQPQPLYPREFVQYLLHDAPYAGSHAEATSRMEALQRQFRLAPNYFKNLHRATEHETSEREQPLPKVLRVRLEHISGDRASLWSQSEFSSADADTLALRRAGRPHYSLVTRTSAAAEVPFITTRPDPYAHRKAFHRMVTQLDAGGSAVFSPVEFLHYTLIKNGLSDDAFIQKLGVNPSYLNALFSKDTALSASLVQALSALSGEPASFWQQARFAVPETPIPVIDLSKPAPSVTHAPLKAKAESYVHMVGQGPISKDERYR